MDDSLHILVADYVPTANKGEEAIVRGIEDMLSGDRPVALGLFDNVPQMTQRENLTLFPREWLFRCEGNGALSGRGRLLAQARVAAQLRLGIYGPLRNLTGAGKEPCRPLAEFFDRARYVLVGHDGVFGVESCGIIHLAKRHDKRVGILGASTGIGGGRLYKAGLYRRALRESDFCFFRESHSRASMAQVCRHPDKLRVGPDPAFAMRPARPESARRILEHYEPYRRARQEGRPVVAAAVLEKGRVYAGFRPDLRGSAKQQTHAKYLAAVLDGLVAEHRAMVLFVPHSLEPGGNDAVAARHVVERMQAGPGDVAVLEQDCGARLLKSIIGECDFLVGERTHALIAGVSMGTAFVALTNRQDTRTHGIIGTMCRCEDRIIDMDVTSESEAARRVGELFQTREPGRKSLDPIRAELAGQLEEMAGIITGSHGSISQP